MLYLSDYRLCSVEEKHPGPSTKSIGPPRPTPPCHHCLLERVAGAHPDATSQYTHQLPMRMTSAQGNGRPS